jgi:hypothetical protein
MFTTIGQIVKNKIESMLVFEHETNVRTNKE